MSGNDIPPRDPSGSDHRGRYIPPFGLRGPRETVRNPGMVFVDLMVGNGAQPDNVSYQQVPIMGEFLEQFTQRRLSHDASIAEFTLFDPTFDNLETLILASNEGDQPLIAYEFGWIDSETGSRRSSGLIYGRVSWYKPQWTFQGMRLQFEVVEFAESNLHDRVRDRDFGVGAEREGSESKPQMLPGLRISDIVETLASEMNLTVDRDSVVKTRNFVHVRQNNMTNMAFIKQVLAPLAIAEDGTKNFGVRIEGRQLVFAPAPYLHRKTYYFGKDLNGEMLAFNAEIDKGQVFWGAWGKIKGVAFSPFKKELYKVSVGLGDPSIVDKNNVSLSPSTFDGATPTEGAGLLYSFPFMLNSQLKAAIENKHRELITRCFVANAIVIGEPFLRPLDTITIYLVGPSRASYISGNYLVIKIEHKISNGQYFTELGLQSDGISAQAVLKKNYGEIRKDLGGEIPAASEEVAPVERTSIPENLPGRDLNLRRRPPNSTGTVPPDTGGSRRTRPPNSQFPPLNGGL